MTPRDHPDNSHSTISRRTFLKVVGAGLMVVAIPAFTPRRAGAEGNTAQSPSDQIMSQSAFSALVGQPFLVNGGLAGSLTFRLSRVQNGVARIFYSKDKVSDAPAGDCFVLVFRGPQNPTLTQNTYEFTHGQLGKFSLFIVPGKLLSLEQNYEAVINHVQA